MRPVILALAPLLATAALAQTMPQCSLVLKDVNGSLAAVVAREGTFAAALLANLDGSEEFVPGFAVPILRGAVTLAVVPAAEDVVLFKLPYPIELLANADAWLQAVSVDAGAMTAASQKLRVRDWVAPLHCPGGVLASQDPPEPLGDVELQLAWTDQYPPRLQFMARFHATSDGFDLQVVKVAGGSPAEIYLYLKTPSSDEGRLDIAYDLQVMVDLGETPPEVVRVLAATAQTPQVPAQPAWHLLGALRTFKP